MTITIDGNSLTGSNLHGTLKSDPWGFQLVKQTFFGLTGEIYLGGGLTGRDHSAWLLLHGFATHAAIGAQIEVINALMGTFGDLVWTQGADVETFTQTLFMGFTTDEDPWEDASGVNGWEVQGRLHFREKKK